MLATGRGIELVGSSGNRIERNTASGNPRSAIALVSSDDNVVDDNAAAGNHVGVFIERIRRQPRRRQRDLQQRVRRHRDRRH